jgi:predicted transcriptional regulator
MVMKQEQLTMSGIQQLLDAQVLCGGDHALNVSDVGAADLMSDVLALSRPGMLLLTGLTNPQVIRTAVVADLCGVVFVRGRKPNAETLKLAREARLPILSTGLTMFEAAGRLYMALRE